MTKFSRVALSVVAAVAAITPALAPSASARHTWIPPVDGSAVPVLARKTILEGSKTGWLRVRLPEPVRVPREFGATGDGRLVAAYLLEEQDGAVPRNGASFAMERFGWCAETGCEPSPWASTSAGARTGRDGKLPAGTYRLFLVADGAPASVTIEFPGLSGATRLRPRFHARHELRTLTPETPGGEASPLYSVGAESPFDGRGVAFLGHIFQPRVAGAAAFGYCLYRDAAPADPATAYLPALCDEPRISNTWARYYTPVTPHAMGFTLGMDEIPPAMGAWHVASPPVGSAVTIALWLRTG